MSKAPSSSPLATRIGSLELANPIICASGEHVISVEGIRAALNAGAAGVIAKSVNEQPDGIKQMDYAQYITLRDDRSYTALEAGRTKAGASLFCRSGLAPHDPKWWFAQVAEIDRSIAAERRFVAASIILGSLDAAAQLARDAQAAGVRVLEMNVGAPHGPEAKKGVITILRQGDAMREAVSAVRYGFQGQLWVKLTGGAQDPAELASAARDGGADAVILAGRHMAFLPDLDTLAPAIGTAGAYGGGWALPITCRAIAFARAAVGRDFPLIGTNGARSGLDALRFILAGASAVEFASLVIEQGFGALTTAIGDMEAWLNQRNLRVADLIGVAADKLTRYTDQPAHADAWQSAVPVA